MLAQAQMLAPDVVAVAGNFFSSPSASLSWTAGEPVVETFTAGGNILTQGFQQPELQGVTGISKSLPANDVLVYPNPANNAINLKFGKATAGGPVKIELIDMTGKIIYKQSTLASRESVLSLDLSELEPGLYVLKITGVLPGDQQLFKIQKTN